MDLEKIRKQIKSGRSIEDVLKKVDWKDFEKTVGEIFSQHNFKVKRNLRFKTKKRYEIDIFASKRNFAICVDCKQWEQGRYKASAVKNSIKKQIERIEELKTHMKEVIKIYPMIITLFDEDIIKENNVFVVPVWKLNSFLLEIENVLQFFYT